MLVIRMATPKAVRLFVSPSGRSSLSPRLLTVKNQVLINRSPKRKLEFSPSVSEKQTTHSTFPKFDFKLVDYELLSSNNKKHILLNTPNKSKILKHGINFKEDVNILGKGTFGTVVKGFYKDQEVAVKVVKTNKKLHEANGLILNHKNIVKTLDLIMKNESHAMIIMEYLENSLNLQTIIDCETFELDFSKIIDFGKDIVKGLQHCHQKNILHLDLKPANVLVHEGICKICDFGNSAVLGCQQLNENGTAQYTAPEMLKGNLPSFASDVYSLGIIFWQLRYREIPYKHLGSKDSVIYKVVKYGMRPNTLQKQGLSKEIDDKYAALYKSCWDGLENSRPALSTVLRTLEKF